MCIELIRKCPACHTTRHFDWAGCYTYKTALLQACKAGTPTTKPQDCPGSQHKDRQVQETGRPLSMWECQNESCPLRAQRPKAMAARKAREALSAERAEKKRKDEEEGEEEGKRAFESKHFRRRVLKEGMWVDMVQEKEEEKEEVVPITKEELDALIEELNLMCGC